MSTAAHDGDLGSILAVFAHPDDEAYLAGGLMAIGVESGHRVVCVTATRGEFGFADDDSRSIEDRRAVREAELDACLEVLGVREHLWLDYADLGCASVPPGEAAARLREIIDGVRPDTVLTFGPDGGTFHEDHIAVGHWTTLACRSDGAPPARLLYATKTPEWNAKFRAAVDLDEVMMVEDTEPPTTPSADLAVWFTCDDALVERKADALLCQSSQVEGLVEQTGFDTFRELVREEFLRDPAPDDWPD